MQQKLMAVIRQHDLQTVLSLELTKSCAPREYRPRHLLPYSQDVAQWPAHRKRSVRMMWMKGDKLEHSLNSNDQI